jgi:hypothetical protein
MNKILHLWISSKRIQFFICQNFCISTEQIKFFTFHSLWTSSKGIEILISQRLWAFSKRIKFFNIQSFWIPNERKKSLLSAPCGNPLNDKILQFQSLGISSKQIKFFAFQSLWTFCKLTKFFTLHYNVKDRHFTAFHIKIWLCQREQKTWHPFFWECQEFRPIDYHSGDPNIIPGNRNSYCCSFL